LATYEHLLYEAGPVTVITVNRPERMNAIGPLTHRELLDAWQRFRDDAEGRVAVLTGAGENAFCAGGDLKSQAMGEGSVLPGSEDEVAAHNRGERPGILGPSRWTELTKPTIAAVTASPTLADWNGPADLCVADEHATFGMTCRRWNIGLADGGTQRLPRIVGLRRAMELIITGRVIDAQEAHRIGLVNEVVPRGTCRARAIELGQMIADLPQPAIRTDKEAVVRGLGRPLDEGLRIEAQCFNRLLGGVEMREGVDRFLAGER
jgi:enoyl-CoA hydratase/carnithine racemase